MRAVYAELGIEKLIDAVERIAFESEDREEKRVPTVAEFIELQEARKSA